ncbi:hypothetical protein Ais01nite_73760 [Asanoa ishikariensis]|uniref:hypothetical protein n=1 Tax=Asanoa ishikariensis TaxID=137265 RepID=UPI00115F826F|nr:hypothetical protein [Asanoa ishikariensis]GIF69341.1 hypothetical protein Ais01nite_73760 [Asanoa ishikariensis]
MQELALIKRECTFPLSEVTTPVRLWHRLATVTRRSPSPVGSRANYPTPPCTSATHRGHDVGVDRSDEIVSVLTSDAN